MLKQFFKLMVCISLPWVVNQVAAADVGYIKHKFTNQTPYECYVDVHQQYSYPIDTCLGTVATAETKICDGSFEPHQPNFLLYAVCKDVRQHLEINKIVFLRNTYKSDSMEVLWTLQMVKRKLNVNYQEHSL